MRGDDGVGIGLHEEIGAAGNSPVVFWELQASFERFRASIEEDISDEKTSVECLG